MNRLTTLVVAALVLIGGAFYLSTLQSGTSGLAPLSVSAQEAGDVDTSGIVDMTLGDPDAPVTVVEYASFTCPHCSTFHSGPFKRIKAEYIDTGKVNFIYREVYFDRFGLWAGLVARCGGAPRYFGLVDLIYQQQREWTQGEPGQIAENLRRLGKTAGLSDAQLDACMQDADKAQALVAVFQDNSEKDQITSTPSFIIDGEKHSNMSYDDFAALIDAALAD